jgi:hypothetical protein
LLPAPTGAALIVNFQLRTYLPNLAAPLSAENTKLVKQKDLVTQSFRFGKGSPGRGRCLIYWSSRGDK